MHATSDTYIGSITPGQIVKTCPGINVVVLKYTRSIFTPYGNTVGCHVIFSVPIFGQ